MNKRADKRKYHYIYKITRCDGKYYIGMHSTDDLDDGYFGSGKQLWHSIKKYGRGNHSKIILEFCDTRAALRDREKQLVTIEKVNDKMCMNLIVGGELTPFETATFEQRQSWWTPERRANASHRAKKNWKNPEYRTKLNSALRSRTLTEEQRAKRSLAVKQMWANMTVEEKEARKLKISKSCSGKNHWEGRKHSEESKQKMRHSAKNRKTK
jgi:hypothetical protein